MKGGACAVLYARPDCAPCFALKRLAARAARRHGMTLAIVDITGEPDLEARYGLRVPVLILPGGEALEGRVEAGEIERAFREAAHGAPAPDDAGDGARDGGRRPTGDGARGWGRLAATLRAALRRGGGARGSEPR